MLEKDAADDRPDRNADAGHGSPDPDRLRPLAGIGEHLDEDRQGRGHNECGAHSHHCPAGGKTVNVGHHRGPERTSCEDHEPGEKHGVGINDPLELRRSGAEILLEAWEGNIDDHRQPRSWLAAPLRVWEELALGPDPLQIRGSTLRDDEFGEPDVVLRARAPVVGVAEAGPRGALALPDGCVRKILRT